MSVELSIAAFMITYDRSPRKNYVAESLMSLQASGFFEASHIRFALINASSYSARHLDFLDQFGSAVNLVNTPEESEQPGAFHYGLVEACNHDCDVVLCMEDDVKVCRRFPDRVRSFIIENGGNRQMWDFVTYYDRVFEAYLDGRAFWDMRARDFFGNQCFALTRHAAQSFAHYISDNLGNRPGYTDTWVADWLTGTYGVRTIRCAVPSLAQHIGTESSLGHQYIATPGFADDLERPLIRSDQYRAIFTSRDCKLVDRETASEVCSLNRASAMLYELCNGERHVREVFESLKAALPEEKAEAINRGVRKLVTQLKQLGALQ